MDTFLLNLIVGIAGIVFYNLLAFRRFINVADLSSKVFWQSYKTESLPIWIWSLAVIISVDLIITLAPEVAPSLTTLTGWEIGTNPASYLTLAFAVSATVSDKKK